MKVLLINGSSRPNGNTDAGLAEAARALQEEGIDTEVFFIGDKPLPDCIACYKCFETGSCVFNDKANELVEKAKEADGFIFGSPVYYAHPSARILTVMDRAFFSGNRYFAFKPAASLLTARRAGTTASFDVINKYFTMNSMPVVSSTYWNSVYGGEMDPAETKQDEEGMMTLYNLGKNMAWMLQCIELGKQNNIPLPANVRAFTNFIR